MKHFFVFGVIAFWILLNSPAIAHKINIFAYTEGNTIQGEVYFNDGSPAKNTKITLYSVKGDKVLAETKTDKEGIFKLPIPKGLKEVKVVAWAEMGHRAEMKLKLSQNNEIASAETTQAKVKPANSQVLPEVAAANSISEELFRKIIREEVRKEMAPLKKMIQELARQADKPSLGEILGGIGYIFGLFGVWAWFQARGKRGK
ncbi:hypothetical protein [Thermodesulfatator autotrophicus]|uniref:Cobalt ABC transporter permease n=1 Tax=Thermodesulfatator autotrophicus TaxID=1795632 RepID=A0A177E9V7_9BACT|nr:hypothetical protein [Thermodesulfatator autotrophicus]OAG28724.1 hypothetical protein TH606_00220 [Thermodesulfatator autotrophicus]